MIISDKPPEGAICALIRRNYKAYFSIYSSYSCNSIITWLMDHVLGITLIRIVLAINSPNPYDRFKISTIISKIH